ncbi:hypothetical protein N9355_05020 [Crocinitomicaceae bacterium]|nr:hypothetical protein [Crocinitomicaceae bacterium]
MKKLNIIILSICLGISAVSCKKEKFEPETPSIAVQKQPIDQLFEDYLDSKVQSFTVGANTATTITGEQGTVITLSGSNFLDASGNPLTGNVTIDLVEIYFVKDMILTNKRTLAQTGTNQYEMLSSGGEFFINVTQNGAPVTIGTLLSVTTKSVFNPVWEMELFSGSTNVRGDVTWNAFDTVTFVQDTISVAYNFPFDNSFNWINCDYFWSYPQPQTDVSIVTPSGCDNSNTKVFLAFTDEESVASLNALNENVFSTGSYYSLPEGLSLYVVVIKEENGQISYAIEQTTITTNHEVTIPGLLNVASMQELETILESIL